MATWFDLPTQLRYGGHDLRVSDAERTEIADILSRHYSDGRLDHNEFDERVDAAMHAKTRAELDRVLVDLPRLDAPAPVERPHRQSPFAFVLFLLLVAVAASITLHVVLNAVAVWPFVILFLFLIARGRGYHGHRHHHVDRYSR